MFLFGLRGTEYCLESMPGYIIWESHGTVWIPDSMKWLHGSMFMLAHVMATNYHHVHRHVTLVNWFWGPVTFKISLAISFSKMAIFAFISSGGQLSFRQFELGNDFGGLQLDSFFSPVEYLRIVEMLSSSFFHLILDGFKRFSIQKIISEMFRG